MPNDYELDQSQMQEGGDVVVEANPLLLPVEDNELISLIQSRIIESNKRYKELNIDSRRKKLKAYFLGDQVNKSNLYDYQHAHVDNLIFRDFETRIALAAGRMPDIIAVAGQPEGQGMMPAGQTPDQQSPQQQSDSDDVAKTIEKTLEQKVKNDANKRMIKDGLRHHGLNFTAAIKCYWDKNKDKKFGGDFVFELIRPSNIMLDASAVIPHDRMTADNCQIIVEDIEEATDLVLAKFPDKADALKQAVAASGGKVPSKIKYQQVWFTYYDKQGNALEGKCHRYKNIVLDKEKNPYYDWEGYEQPTGEVGLDGQPKTETKTYNYFQEPHKPYIIFSYLNMGTSPLDDTTPVEQAIPLQDIYNRRRRQITEIADNAVPKKVYAGNAITKDQVATLTNDPNESVYLEGATNLQEQFAIIPATPPSPVLFSDMQDIRSEIDSIFATHSVTRGENTPGQSGLSKQITREGDLTIADDLVDVVVERVVSEMAQWAMQMIKLFYREPRLVKELDTDGDVSVYNISRDLIDENINIIIKANTVDKAAKRSQSIDLASSGNSDPYSLYEDLEIPNPKERAQRLIAFKNGATTSYAQYREIIGDPSIQAGPPAPTDMGQPAGDMPPEGATPPEGGLPQQTPSAVIQNGAPLPGISQQQPQ